MYPTLSTSASVLGVHIAPSLRKSLTGADTGNESSATHYWTRAVRTLAASSRSFICSNYRGSR
jgi:hypothetical protein